MKNYKKVLALVVLGILILSMVGLGLSGASKIKDYNQNEEIITIADSFAESVNVTSNETHIFLDNGNFDIEMEYIDFFVPSELQDNLRYVTPCDSPNGFYCQGNHSDEIYGTDKLFHIKTDPNAGEDNFYALVDYLFDYESSGSDVSSAVDFIIYSAGQGNSILYAVDDVVIYDSKYYNCKQQIFNYNGIPTSLTQYWEEIQPGERTDVPEGFGWKRINYEFTMNPNQNNLNNIIMSSYGSANDINISLVSNGYDIIQTWEYYNEGNLTASYNKIYQGAEASYQLLSNECDENFRFCNAIIKTNLKEEGKLLDAIDFQINKVRWYKIYLNTTGETINQSYFNNTSNQTEYHLINAPDWTLYNNQDTIGEKIWKIEAEKRPSWLVDWVIEKFGVSLTEWATWGNISTGDDAEVILNSPANNSISLTSENQFNASVNITNGAYITNISLWTDESGSWEGYNSTTFEYDDTIHNPDSVTNPTNAFDFDNGTYALKSTSVSTSATWYLGKTYNSRNIEEVFLKFYGRAYSGNCGASGCNANINVDLEYYNGTNWLKDGDVFDDSCSATGGCSVSATNETNYSLINSDNEGIRLKIGLSHSGGTTDGDLDARWYSIEYADFDETDSSTQTFNRTLTKDIILNFQACDSDGVCGFAEENRTLLLDLPNFTITSPSTSLTTSAFNLNYSIGSVGTVNYTYFNVTRGASTEIANTQLTDADSDGYYNYSGILSSEASYVLNIWANQSEGISNYTSYPFTYAIPVTPPTGGGGSTTVIISGEAGWTMETAPDQSMYEKKRPKNTEKDLTIDFENIGDSSRDIELFCEDLEGDGCKFVSFDEKTFNLPLIKDTKLRETFTITTDDVRGDYRFNIIAIDDLGRTGAITVDLQVGGLGLLAVFYKIGVNSTNGVPYAVVFFPVLIGLFILFYSKVLEKVPVRSIWSMLIAFLIASGSIAFW